ncbi:hypothetical protein [Bradyrhizobium sp. dw_78]|uniref:hypothetical protein n=1 Tax=Bradyrhizobium sp. dw_78 TaxID=2719793 RepID=UPI001BD2A068|nr:hypothetical protein [Bradyrhizobium sp. dw_78]
MTLHGHDHPRVQNVSAQASRGLPNLGRRLASFRCDGGCQRCSRIVEIQKADAIRFYGQHAIWKEVGQRLL